MDLAEYLASMVRGAMPGIDRPRPATVHPMDALQDQFNTPLGMNDESQFQHWLGTQSTARGRDMRNDLGSYDMRGFWKAGGPGLLGTQGHFPDTFKKPNHPTFSDESQYHGFTQPSGEVMLGGHWNQDANQKWQYTVPPTGNQYWLREQLESYLRRAEPDVNVNWGAP